MKVIYPKKFSNSRNKIIIDYCKWKKILHIWACDSPFTESKYTWEMWPLLYREIDKVCENQLWIDLDKNSINFLNLKKDEFTKSEIKFFDMNKLEDLDYKPDVIIFWEVIEHLMNLEIALNNLKKIMTNNTLLIISTPNAFYISNFIRTLFWYEIIHEDHKVLFSYWYIKNLLRFNDINIKDAYFTFLDRKEPTSFFRKIIVSLISIFSSIFKWTSDTLLIISKK